MFFVLAIAILSLSNKWRKKIVGAGARWQRGARQITPVSPDRLTKSNFWEKKSEEENGKYIYFSKRENYNLMKLKKSDH